MKVTVSPSLLRLPGQVVYGSGAIVATGRAARGLGRRALICTDQTIAASPSLPAAAGSLADAGIEVRVFADSPPEVPLSSVDDCVAMARCERADLLVGLGGGSCLDLAKVTALVLAHGGPLERYYDEGGVPGPVLPVVAVPTTAGTGSEVSPVAVVADPARRLKVGLASPHLVPRVAICDPTATLECPPSVTANAGLDALAHAVEAFLAPRRELGWDHEPGPVFRGGSPLSDVFAFTAVEHIAPALEAAVANPADLGARESVAYGSLCAGIAFSHAGTGLAHALQYPVGAATRTPHGLGVALLLPYALELLRDAAKGRLALLAGALGVGDGGRDDHGRAIEEVARLADAVGIPSSLAEIGVERDDLRGFAEQAVDIGRLLRNAPLPLGVADLHSVLEAAWLGIRGMARTVTAAS